MKTFLDSSAFAKRYVEEPGSEETERACYEATAIGLSVLCVPEILSALKRRRRERTLTSSQYVTAKRQLLEEIHDVDMIHLTPPVVSASIAVLEDNPVRALDALQIACALEWGADVFISADQRQRKAAQYAGLETKIV